MADPAEEAVADPQDTGSEADALKDILCMVEGLSGVAARCVAPPLHQGRTGRR